MWWHMRSSRWQGGVCGGEGVFVGANAERQVAWGRWWWQVRSSRWQEKDSGGKFGAAGGKGVMVVANVEQEVERG